MGLTGSVGYSFRLPNKRITAETVLVETAVQKQILK
jgi:hypothetical protein